MGRRKEVKDRPECPRVPYEKDLLVDPLFTALMQGAFKSCQPISRGGRDKKVVILCAGDVGGGKSSLGFHAWVIVDSEPSLDRLGSSTRTFAQAVAKLKGKSGQFAMHDEFNLNSRSSMSEHNRDFIDMMLAIRGENWFLWVNNPSVKSIDKQLIEEGLVNFIFFIHKPQEGYLCFTREGLFNLIKERGSASFPTLMEYGTQYAIYEGWFKAFSGPLWDEYIKLKEERMHEKKNLYVAKYGQGDLVSMNSASKALGVSFGTASKAFRWGVQSKMLVEERDYITTGTKVPKLTTDGLENLRYIIDGGFYLGKQKKI